MLRREDGVALTELAFVLPLLLLLLLGMVDFGKAFNYWIDETHLANEASRLAVVNFDPGGGMTLQQYIQQQGDTKELVSGGTDSLAKPAQVCVSFPTNPSTNTSKQVGDPVKVTVAITYTWLSYITNKVSIAPTSTVVASSTMRLEQPPGATNIPAGCYPS